MGVKKKKKKKKVSLTDKFYGLAGEYHLYIFKYEEIRKYLQLFKSYSKR